MSILRSKPARAALISGLATASCMLFVLKLQGTHHVTKILKRSDNLHQMFFAEITPPSLVRQHELLVKDLRRNDSDSTYKIHPDDPKATGFVVNPHNFKYIINNESICDGADYLHYIIYVHTAPAHFDRRQQLRQTWGQNNLIPSYPSRLVFFLGDPQSEEVQKKVYEEAKIHGDIIQEDYVDSYHNLTHKGVQAWKWISTNCKQARYVLKSDDDVFVDLFYFFRVFRGKIAASRTRFLAGLIWDAMSVFRDPKTCMKWCIKDWELPGMNKYPKYCSGAFYIISSELMSEFYETSLITPFFWVDDAYLSGIVPRRVGNVSHIDIGKFYRYDDRVFKGQYNNSKGLNWFCTLTSDYKTMWKLSIEFLPKEDIDLLGEKRYNQLKCEADKL